MPGLLRGVARTAVVAGTATAVSGRVARRQAERYTDRDAQIYAERQAAYDQYAAAPPPPPPPAPAPAPAPAAAPAAQVDVVAQLKGLAELKEQGVLTDAEFQAQKARILGG